MNDFIEKIRSIPSLERAMVSSVVLKKEERRVEINIITDKSFDENCLAEVKRTAASYVPEEFSCGIEIVKLVPDEKMVSQKILQAISAANQALYATISEDDIKVERTENGFYFTLSSVLANANASQITEELISYLKKNFCCDFGGRCLSSDKDFEDMQIEEEQEEIEFTVPIRKFNIRDFSFIESGEVRNTAVYMSDMNFESESVIVCGTIERISERTYKRNNGQEKVYYSFIVTDTTATMRATYFTRQRSIEKIKKLQVGDSIVLTGKSEIYRGEVRFTANFIDYGKIPENFVPEKRLSKPVPKFYKTVRPQVYEDFTQTDLFTKEEIPDCLKDNEFVVFDLETTGLNSSPSAGNMDRIIEIGAYKIKGGAIKEYFSTFVNPERKLSEEIISLTGIRQDMVDGAPTYEQVMPDFFKFCENAYLVGHNAAGFDFKFVEHYCAKLGYMLERRVFDTIPLSQELLFLSNYKLNTVADHFGITFNHHRAVDDALVTAKIFMELIKIKKSLPKLC